LWEQKSQLVVDTSVAIDLFNGGILDAAVKLPYYFLLPDVILAEELQDPPASTFTSAGFIAAGTTGSEMYIVEDLSKKYIKPSRNDFFALTIAKSGGLTLLSGDKALTIAARREGVTVHGALWVLDQLLSESIIAGGAAADALERILAKNARLPERECSERLKKWRG
jgi:hypothetical protein